MVTLTNPETNTTFVDRFLATAEAYRVPVVMAINKIDLLSAEEDKELLDAFAYLYESIGYPVIKMSTLTGEGIDQLKAQLKDKTTLFSGNSGVGKSSLINMLVPDANLKVGDVSETHHTGMHMSSFCCRIIDLCARISFTEILPILICRHLEVFPVIHTGTL